MKDPLPLPRHGGTFLRHADGSLTEVPPGDAPATAAAPPHQPEPSAPLKPARRSTAKDR